MRQALLRGVARVLARAPRGLFLGGEVFSTWEAAGYHITPSHFYEPVPELSRLPDSAWSRSDCVGIDLNEAAQIELLGELAALAGEYATLATGNTYYGAVDAEVLYGMIRRLRPSRVVEIGSGYSTQVILTALAKNGHGRIECIEPFETDRMPIAPAYAVPVQDVPLAVFESLEANDVLFVDSSHVLKLGSDVKHEYLEILPRLAPGVVVHIHDIFLPYEYPRDWAEKLHRFWNEQYVLQAFLALNPSFEVVWASHFMSIDHRELLENAFPTMTRESRPGSFWIRRTEPQAR